MKFSHVMGYWFVFNSFMTHLIDIIRFDSLAKDKLHDRIFYIYIYIYIYIHLFGLPSYNFQNNFITVLNTHHLLLLTFHKNILFFTLFSRKRKYYKELLSYKQCRLTRITNKGGCAIVFWGQCAEIICLIALDRP